MLGTTERSLGKTFNDVVAFTHYLRLATEPRVAELDATPTSARAGQTFLKDDGSSPLGVRYSVPETSQKAPPVVDDRIAWCPPADMGSQSAPLLRSLSEPSTTRHYGVVVDRINARDISIADFQTKYLDANRPVVLSWPDGTIPDWTAFRDWTKDRLLASGAAGDVLVGVSARPSEMMFDRSASRIPLRDFVARYFSANCSDNDDALNHFASSERPYVFEKLLDTEPSLRQGFTIPAFFQSDQLESQPDFFEFLLGGAGTGALTHIHQVRNTIAGLAQSCSQVLPRTLCSSALRCSFQVQGTALRDMHMCSWEQ
eukprot:m.1492571 g.1492571  ORF g.1492571 m.1492571 type:complete len:314 (+) comp25196_c0_seq11:2035-2976(+)